MSQTELIVLQPFGPSIVKVKIPENIINNINKYIDDVINNEEKSKKLDYGFKLVGNVKQEIRLEKEIVEQTGCKKFLAEVTAKWREVTNKKKISEFKIIDTWVVRQFANEYNPIHWHSGHISGAGFLKVPTNLGQNFQKEKKIKTNGQLELIHGNKAFMSNPKFSITPAVGDFYIFPHYMMHTVYPFTGSDEERRSISFNATIDSKIFDVFS